MFSAFRTWQCDSFPTELRKIYALKDNDFCKEMWDYWPERSRPYCADHPNSVLPKIAFFRKNEHKSLCTVDLGKGVKDELRNCAQLTNELIEANPGGQGNISKIINLVSCTYTHTYVYIFKWILVLL